MLKSRRNKKALCKNQATYQELKQHWRQNGVQQGVSNTVADDVFYQKPAWTIVFNFLTKPSQSFVHISNASLVWTCVACSQPHDTAVHSPNEITLNKFFITSGAAKKRRHFSGNSSVFCSFVDISAHCQYAEPSLPMTASLCAVGPWVVWSK